MSQLSEGNGTRVNTSRMDGKKDRAGRRARLAVVVHLSRVSDQVELWLHARIWARRCMCVCVEVHEEEAEIYSVATEERRATSFSAFRDTFGAQVLLP